jgi:predicted nucleic acid-binding protein
MTRFVVDASVVVKWLAPDRTDEADSEIALGILSRVRDGTVELVQPPHWLAEVAAVLTRISPSTVMDDIADLYAMELPVLDSPEIYLAACELSSSLGQHLFDTLYHAVALHFDGTTLVTADERYYRKGASLGSIALLSDLTLLPDVEE